MKALEFLKKNKQYAIYAGCAVAFMIFALCIKVEANNGALLVYELNQPFEWVASGVRALGESENGFYNVLSYALYIVFCLLPLAYPIYRTVSKKKFAVRDVIFFAASVFLFVMTFYFINPHLIGGVFDKIGTDAPQEILDGMVVADTAAKGVVKLGMSSTFWVLIILGVLAELYCSLQSRSDRAFAYARHVIYAFVIAILFSVFFLAVYALKSDIINLPAAYNDGVKLYDARVTRFNIVFSFIMKCVPCAAQILLLILAERFTHALQTDFFAPTNVKLLSHFELAAKWSIVAIILSQVVANTVTLLCAKQLLNASYNTEVPVALIFTVCLVTIFAKILARAIEVNEENKLVI